MRINHFRAGSFGRPRAVVTALTAHGGIITLWPLIAHTLAATVGAGMHDARRTTHDTRRASARA